MKNLRSVCIFLTSCWVAGTTWASDVRVEVPRTTWASARTEAAERRSPIEERSRVTLSLSSWAPAELKLASRLPEAGSFSQSAPGVQLTWTSPAWLSGRLAGVSLEFGLGASRFSRSAEGVLSPAGSVSSATETMTWLSARVGGVLRPHLGAGDFWTPELRFSLLPTGVLKPESPISAGRASFALPAEGSIGASFRVMRLLLTGEMLATAGTLDGSSLWGWGARGGVGYEL